MQYSHRFYGAALALALLASAAKAQPAKQFAIDFTPLVDTTQGFTSFGTFPSINNHGEVAFLAARLDGVSGIFRVQPAVKAVTTIASSTEGFSIFGDDCAINPSGIVAFAANTSTGSRAIYAGDGDARTRIADTVVNGFVQRNLGSPSINAAGTVAFSATLAQRGSPAGVFSGSGGPLRTVVGTSAGGFQSFQNVAINDSETVVFVANLADGGRGVFTFQHQAEDIVDSIHHPEIDTLDDPVINNAGTVADVAFVFPFDAPEVFTANARGFTPRNDPTNPRFTDSDHPSLNNRDAVAFAAIPLFGASDPTGIFLEVSGGQSLIPVVRPGDKLFGSTVDHVSLGRFALNDRFQMAFSYTLVDGRSGIAVAAFNGEAETAEGIQQF